MMKKTIFQQKEVPKFICQLHDTFPDLYSEYLNTYPEEKERFDTICGNYVGRKAYLNSLKDGAIYIDCHRNKWVKNGEWLVCEDYSTWLAIGKKARKCMQQIMGDEIVTVLSNDYVSKDTIFAE